MHQEEEPCCCRAGRETKTKIRVWKRKEENIRV
jgi:hypothetical protein